MTTALEAATTRLTLDEFLALPEPEDGSKLEFWDGEVVVMPPAGMKHGSIARRIGGRLGDFADELGLGEVVTNDSGFTVGDNVLGPDVAWVAADRFSDIPDGHFTGPPDLAVEVVSPSDLDSRVAEKVGLYLSAGVSRVWIVRPAQQTVTIRGAGLPIHELSGADVINSHDAGFPVEGFALRVSDIFATNNG